MPDVGIHVPRGRVFLADVRQEIDARIHADQDFVVTQAQAVAVTQFDTTLVGRGIVGVVHEHAIGARIAEPEAAAVILHLEMMARDHPLRIGQYPVIVGRAAHGAAVDAKYARPVRTEFAVLLADDS